MITFVFALLFATGASDAHAEPRCVLQGTLAMSTADGKDLKGNVTAVAYVKWLPRKAWPHTPETKTVVQKDRQFSPPLVVLVQHDSVKFVNEDNIEHSVFANDDVNGFDLPRSKKGETGTATFEELGAVRVQCDIHPSMRTDVLVVQNPVWAVVSTDGSWRLGPLPFGDYQVVAWEPNGAKVETKKLHCEGELNVELPRLQRAKEKQTFHKSGEGYRPGPY